MSVTGHAHDLLIEDTNMTSEIQVHNVSRSQVIDDEPVAYDKWCIHCHKCHRFIMSNDEFTKWKIQKTFIQTVFPHLDADTREMMISGTCPPCFNEIMA